MMTTPLPQSQAATSPSFGSIHQGTHVNHYRVYYEDTDAGGVVYYANYLRFAERARTDALRTLGIEQSHLREQTGQFFVVTRCEIDFIRSARLDDLLQIETQLIALRKVRMSMDQIIRREASGEELVKLTVSIAMIDGAGKPSRIPDEVCELLMRHYTPAS